MSPVTAASILAGWILAVGLLAVYFEVETVQCGARVRELQARETELLDDLRRWEMRYNELLSPDLLEKELPEEYLEVSYPIPEPDLLVAPD